MARPKPPCSGSILKNLGRAAIDLLRASVTLGVVASLVLASGCGSSGDGICDACQIMGGVTTENEMFGPSITYFVQD